jgi:hypothetical protein
MQQQAGHNKTEVSCAMKRVGPVDPRLEIQESEKLIEMAGNKSAAGWDRTTWKWQKRSSSPVARKRRFHG